VTAQRNCGPEKEAKKRRADSLSALPIQQLLKRIGNQSGATDSLFFCVGVDPLEQIFFNADRDPFVSLSDLRPATLALYL
jgi:hypothetical protein